MTTDTAAGETAPVRHDLLDGEPVAYVPLRGKHGLGHYMILDRDTCDRLGEDVLRQCVVTMSTRGTLSIRLPKTEGQPIRQLAQEAANAPLWGHVTPANGDWRDLRRCNLGHTRELARAAGEARRRAAKAARQRGRQDKAELRRVTDNGRRDIVGVEVRADLGTVSVWTREKRMSLAELERRTAALMAAAEKSRIRRERQRQASAEKRRMEAAAREPTVPDVAAGSI